MRRRLPRSTRTDHSFPTRRSSVLSMEHPGLHAGIGISCGTVVAGNVGSRERFEYTVIGRAVNEAARLTELAKSRPGRALAAASAVHAAGRSEEHTSELQSLMRNSYAVFCLKKKNKTDNKPA